jgi:hypothetical protein
LLQTGCPSGEYLAGAEFFDALQDGAHCQSAAQHQEGERLVAAATVGCRVMGFDRGRFFNSFDSLMLKLHQTWRSVARIKVSRAYIF